MVREINLVSQHGNSIANRVPRGTLSVHIDAAAVLGDDAADDRQPEAAAALLRRAVRQKQLVALGRRNAGPLSATTIARGCWPASCCVSMSIAPRRSIASMALSTRLMMTRRICSGSTETRGSDSAKCGRISTSREQAAIQPQRVVEQRVQVGRHGTRRRHPRELRELVHQTFQRLDLADDRRRALVDQRAGRLRRAARSAAADARRTAGSASADS